MSVLPPHTPGMKIGLFGGTFDPPHDAHRAACLIAMRRLGLDCVWWLVTPGNPLKDTRGLPPLEDRIAAAHALANHPRIVVTGLEAAIGARYTYDTIGYLKAHCPGVRFRLDHGRRQSAQLPSLGELARHRVACCRSRWWTGSARASTPPAAPRRHALARFRIPRQGGAVAGRPQAAGLGLPARAEIAAVLDRAARRPAVVAKPPLKMMQNTALRNGEVVETINPPCLS